MFPDIIKILRKDQGLSQQKVADELKISRSVLSNYEAGLVEPTLSVIEKMANFYGVSIDYLVGREDDFGNIVIYSDSPMTESEKRLITAFRKLVPNMQSYMLANIEMLAAQN